MFCPRCGNAVTETTKYCKSCGLPMMQVYSYVSNGGTAPLTPLPAQEPQPGGFTYKQKKVLAILAFVFAPGIIPILIGPINGALAGWLAGLSGVLMPLGIVWSVYYFNAKIRAAASSQSSSTYIAPPTPEAAYQPPTPLLRPHPTNPLNEAPRRPAGSVVDDETRPLPNNQAGFRQQ